MDPRRLSGGKNYKERSVTLIPSDEDNSESLNPAAGTNLAAGLGTGLDLCLALQKLQRCLRTLIRLGEHRRAGLDENVPARQLR